MINFLKKLFKKEPRFQSQETLFTELPADVQRTATLYPVIHTLCNNKAFGEIRKFVLENNKLRIGQALVINKEREIWVHIGKDFFKNVVNLQK